eukprot:scaffold204358_cov57-Attheya_sp.AAC.1
MAEDGASCGDSCGWAAAVVAMLAFGSFGVPIKSDASNSVDIDPLGTYMLYTMRRHTFQFDERKKLTRKYEARTWFSFIYTIAFTLLERGYVGFRVVLLSSTGCEMREGVRSTLGATGAVGLMCIGLWGMSYYSSPEVLRHEFEPDSFTNNNESTEEENLPANNIGYINVQQEDESQFEDELQYPGNTTELEVKRLDYVDVYGYQICRRKMGLAAAVFNGVWGGSIMAPMHYSK